MLTLWHAPPQGLKETQEDRARDRERIRAAAAFDDFDRRIEKHWTEKVRLMQTAVFFKPRLGTCC